MLIKVRVFLFTFLHLLLLGFQNSFSHELDVCIARNSERGREMIAEGRIRRARGGNAGCHQICSHDEEAQDGIIERLSGGSTVPEIIANSSLFSGGEVECLREAGLLKGNQVDPRYYTNALDTYNYSVQCHLSGRTDLSPIDENSIEDFESIYANLNFQDHLRNRDDLLNRFWQDLAARSSQQLSCREIGIANSLQNNQKKAQLMQAAREKFEAIKDDLRMLIALKKSARARNQNETYNQYGQNQGFAGVGGWLTYKLISDGRTQRELDNHEKAIAARVSTVPYGFEPAVANALLTMADNGNFNETAYYEALAQTQGKYNELTQYYRDRHVRTGPRGGQFCIDREFKEFAQSSGVAASLLRSLENTSYLRSEQKEILRCKIKAKYGDGVDAANNAADAAFMVGGAVAAVLTAAPTGGGSVGVYAAAVGFGFTAASLANQLNRAHKACTRKEFVISPEGAENCTPEEDFEKELNRTSTSECLMEAGFAIVEAVPAPLELGAIFRARRNVPVDDVVRELNQNPNAWRNADNIADVSDDLSLTARTANTTTTSKRTTGSVTTARTANVNPVIEVLAEPVSDIKNISDLPIARDLDLDIRYVDNQGNLADAITINRTASITTEQTAMDINEVVTSWPRSHRSEVFRFLETVEDPNTRRQYLALLLSDDRVIDSAGNVIQPNAVLDRLKRAQTPEGKAEVLRELELAIAREDQIIDAGRAANPDEISDAQRAASDRRSRLEMQKVILEQGEIFEVTGMFSASRYNKIFEAGGKTPHAVEGTFSLQLRLKPGQEMSVIRGGGSEGVSGVQGGYHRFRTDGGYFDIETYGDRVAAPDPYRVIARSDISEARPFVLGGNNAAFSYSGGGYEIFGNGFRAQLDELRAVVTVPICSRRNNPACEEVFRIQESINLGVLDNMTNTQDALTSLTRAKVDIDNFITRNLDEAMMQRLISEGNSMEDIMQRLARENPELASALVVRQEVNSKLNYFGVNPRPRLDPNTQYTYNMHVRALRGPANNVNGQAENMDDFARRIISQANSNPTIVRQQMLSELRNHPLIQSFRNNQRQIEASLVRLRNTSDPNARREIFESVAELQLKQEKNRLALRTLPNGISTHTPEPGFPVAGRVLDEVESGLSNAIKDDITGFINSLLRTP